MICYVCDGQGKKADAVAVCIVCGMAVCREHVVREELAVWQQVHTGMGQMRQELPVRLPRILCPACAHALHQS